MIPEQWYAVYLSADLKKKKPVGITRFSQKLVLWRDQKGDVVCMPDKCCHRKAQLSLGKITNNCIECPYHGFLYNPEGQVVKIPVEGGKPVSKSYQIDPLIVREHKGLIWLWYGQKVAETDLPSLPWDDEFDKEFSAEPSRTVIFSDQFDISYLRLMENATDLFHVPYVHSPFVPRSWNQLSDFKCEVENNHVRVEGRVHNGKPKHEGLFASVHYVMPATMLMVLGLNAKTRFVASFAPIDEDHMWLSAIYTQDIVRLPLLGKFSSWLLALFDYRLFQRWQDAPIWHSQQPEDPKDIRDYQLIAADRGLIEIFRLRRRLIAEANKKGDKLGTY